MAGDIYVNRQPDYADLDLDFVPNPSTGDVNILSGTGAIKRAVRNLILTNFYERKFQSTIGSEATSILFDNATPLTAVFLKNAIAAVIKDFEPRVQLTDIVIENDNDNNGYNVTLQYIILNEECQ